MKSVVESALAAMIGETVSGLALCAPQYSAGELPDTGTSLVISAEIEHKAGPVYIADVTFAVSTVQEGDGSAASHHGYEQAVKLAACAITGADADLGLTIAGKPYYLGQGGGTDGNRWVSEIRVRFGVLEAA